MTDVARVAGVSHQTVSRVLNGHPSVRPATRDRVLAAIEELGYRPNLAARALVTGRSRTLGLVTLETTLFGPVTTLYGVERAAREAGYFVSVVSLGTAINPGSLDDALARLREQSVAGVILIAPLTSTSLPQPSLPTDLPVVVVEGDPEGAFATAAVDQRAGARAATEHLIGLGHRLIAHVAGPPEWLEAHLREAGWRAALADAGLVADVVLAGDWTARSGYEAGRALAKMAGVTAVFVANDHMALGVLRALHERGRPVPEEISVVGFDDIDEAEYFTPSLTTVHQDFDELGRRSLDLLLCQLGSSSSVAERLVIAPRLVERRSTAAPEGR